MKKLSLCLMLIFFKLGAQTISPISADSLYALGNYQQAILELESMEPKNEIILLKLAKANEAYGNWDVALDNYKEVLSRNPKRVLTAVDYGELLLKAGYINPADSLFTELSKKYPENANFLYKLGLVKEQKNDSLAIAHFTYATILDSTHQQALFKVAKYELVHSNYAMAEHHAKMGLAKNPKNTSLLSILAQTYYNQQLFREAMQEFEKIVALGQGNEFVYSKLGMCYYKSFQYEEAIENYKQCLKFEDRNSDTHFNLGKLYALTEDFEKSEMELLMAILIKKQPVDAEFLSLAITYKSLKDYKKMLEYTQKALEENPDNERALYERAIAADNYFKDISSVIKYYQSYLDKYQKEGSSYLIDLAQKRISDLKKEKHLLVEKEEE